MKKNRLLQLMLFLAIATFMVTACNTGGSPVDAPDSASAEQGSQDAVPVPDDDAGDDLADDAASSEGEDQPDMDLDEAAEPIAPPPEPKAGLEATDPSTVMLASGSPQLVEFFAYW